MHIYIYREREIYIYEGNMLERMEPLIAGHVLTMVALRASCLPSLEVIHQLFVEGTQRMIRSTR